MDPLDEFALPGDNFLKQEGASKILIPQRKYKPLNQDLPQEKLIKEVEEDPWGQESFRSPKDACVEGQPIAKQPQKEGLIKIPDYPYKPNPQQREDKEEFGKRSRDHRGRFRARGSRARNDVVSRVENEKSENTELAWPNAVIEQNIQSAEEFSIKTYKMQKCLIGDKCKGCNRYHFEGERRRDIEKHYYYPALCPRGNNCQNIEKCSKAHNFVEIYYHPQVYRSISCPYTTKFKQCAFGGWCNFLHLIDEVGKESKFSCKACKKSEAEYVRIKCGHLCCGKCSTGNKCLKCGADSVSLKLELSD